MDYYELQVTLAEWLNKDNMSHVIPTLIGFGQDTIEQEGIEKDRGGLRIPAMEYTVQDVPPTPYLAKNANSITLPSDYIEMIYLALTDQIPSPVNATFTSGAGALGAGTYYYRVSAINDKGETLASAETSLVLGGGGGVNVNWTKVDNATGYKVYGRTTNAEQLIATVGDVSTYLDNGSITPSGALPTRNTTGKYKYPVLDRFNNKHMTDSYGYSIDTSSKNRPLVYERSGNSINFNTYADRNYVYELRYYRKLPALSVSASTNFWTDNQPKLLLYACLVESIAYLGDDPRTNLWINLLEKAYKGAKTKYKLEQISGQRERWQGINVTF